MRGFGFFVNDFAYPELTLRNEMAVTLEDIILRRTDLETAGLPDADELHACAALAANELGWNEQETARQIQNVHEVLKCPGS